MGCLSMGSPSLGFQTPYQNPRFAIRELFHGSKGNLSINPTTMQNSLSFHPKFRPTNTLKVGELQILSYCPCSSVLQLPSPNNSSMHRSFASQNNILKVCVKKVAGFLVGSLILMGSFNIGPAIAFPTTQKAGYSASVEEKTDARDDKGENEAMYLKLLEKNPRDVQALKVVLYGKMRKGKTKEALEHVERLIDIEPDEVEWRLLQALSYEMMGHLSRAKRLFKEILEERPLLLRALHGLAMVMHKNHEGSAVFEMLDKALLLSQRGKRVTEERNIRILIAQMHVVKGDLEEALKRFQDLVNDNPRDFRPYLCEGIIYSLLGKKKEADEQFETYRSLVPQEFPQRGFLDDVVLAAKTEPRERLEEEFGAECSYRK
ncbi:PREDICTED: protein SLOW GREEN 1, chloroplastic [Nelumbo nucifera]|uniref:Protein SLOW GREEN 1, chloroplastic n=2 Tax=Nelumbo nucifera TaxID=4432 RepID=A0A1U8AAQ2_NELNU|nr:PREDICTED: protein SLOW GREEN 1, chloroplastic [Nelumbo nucifera]DAD46904.1 TPA_asm: hypothetical protein HUJ06_016841 [Nelumbo nucifera]